MRGSAFLARDTDKSVARPFRRHQTSGGHNDLRRHLVGVHGRARTIRPAHPSSRALPTSSVCHCHPARRDQQGARVPRGARGHSRRNRHRSHHSTEQLAQRRERIGGPGYFGDWSIANAIRTRYDGSMAYKPRDTYAIRLSREERAALNALAEIEHRTCSEVIRRLIREAYNEAMDQGPQYRASFAAKPVDP